MTLTITNLLDDYVKDSYVGNEGVVDVPGEHSGLLPVQAVLLAVFKFDIEALLGIAQVLAETIHQAQLLLVRQEVVTLRQILRYLNMYLAAIGFDLLPALFFSS